MRISVTKKFEFEAAHHLPNYDGPCRNVHGHSYKLEVEIEGAVDEKTGMIIDFSTVKDIVKKYVTRLFDHSNLNDFFDMPTAENMVGSIFKVLSHEINTGGIVGLNVIKVARVRLYETSNSYAEAKC